MYPTVDSSALTAPPCPPPRPAPTPPSIVPVNSANHVPHPPQPNVVRISPAPWSTGLCDCFSDCNSCCLTCWCPCIAFGRVAEIVDKGSTSCGVSGSLYTLIMCLTGCACLYSCFYRSKLRGQYFLQESPCVDCCVHWCCEGCALCQEYRELQNRGFDMSIGWHGNIERQRRLATAIAPQMQAGMTR